MLAIIRAGMEISALSIVKLLGVNEMFFNIDSWMIFNNERFHIIIEPLV